MTGRIKGSMGAGAVGLLAVGLVAPATAQDGTSLEMIAAQYTDEMQPYFDDLAARFMEANPDIDVKVQVVSWNDIDQTVKTRVADRRAAGHREPQLLRELRGRRPALHRRRDRRPGDARRPHPGLPRQLHVRRRRVRRAGPRQRPPLLLQQGHPRGRWRRGSPATWSELLAACDDHQGVPARTSSRSPSRSVPRRPRPSSSSGPAATAASTSTARTWVVNSPENLETLEFLKSSSTTAARSPTRATTDRTNGAWPLFAQGVAAMTNGAIFLPGELEKHGRDVNYGVAPFIANDGKESITLGVQDYFFGFKKDGNQEAIQKFLSFLFQPDNYAAFLEAAGGFLPATSPRVRRCRPTPALAPFIEVLPSAIFYPGDQATWPAVQGAIQQTIGTALRARTSSRSSTRSTPRARAPSRTHVVRAERCIAGAPAVRRGPPPHIRSLSREPATCASDRDRRTGVARGGARRPACTTATCARPRPVALDRARPAAHLRGRPLAGLRDAADVACWTSASRA